TSVQRKCAHCEEEEKEVQRKENNNDNPTEASGETENYINALSGGNSLNEKNKTFFESRMGYDFLNVRLHTDNVATKSAQSVNALAYTSGNDIVFNENQYAPDTDNGKRLLAHELTHVVQQNSGAIQTKLIQRDPPAPSQTPTGPAPSPTYVPSGPPGPSPSLSMPSLTTFVFSYGGFSTRLSLPNSIQASLPVRIRNVGTLTITASSTIPTQFGLSVSLDTINHIRISGNVAYNADTGVGTAGLSVTSMQQVCTMRDPDATRTRLNSLTNDVKTATQAFDTNNIQSIIALGSAIYGLYDAAHDATERCYMQPLWSIGLGAHTPLNPLASTPPAPGTDAGSSYIGLTATLHF
ncbi:MAG: DUF4157 domain-containing protein, partial [Ginsengibacter sp.]